jgi:hypothetical protein
MTSVELITGLATGLGIIATVLNLTAFVREKDRAHTRAGMIVLMILVCLMGLVLLPRFAPRQMARLVARSPQAVRPYLQAWIAEPAASQPAVAVPLEGSFSIDIHRNLFGGIGSLVAGFQFVNVSADPVRVVGYRIRIPQKAGPASSFERVLPSPLVVPPSGAEKKEYDLDAEIRDHWVPWHAQEAAQRGPVEVHWDCLDAQGRRFSVSSSNG